MALAVSFAFRDAKTKPFNVLYETSTEMAGAYANAVVLQYGGNRVSGANPLPVNVVSGGSGGGGGSGIAPATHHTAALLKTFPAANTYYTAFSAGNITNGAWFKSDRTNKGILWIDAAGTTGTVLASTAIPLYPGDYYSLEGAPLDAVSVYGTVASDYFYSASY